VFPGETACVLSEKKLGKIANGSKNEYDRYLEGLGMRSLETMKGKKVGDEKLPVDEVLAAEVLLQRVLPTGGEDTK